MKVIDRDGLNDRLLGYVTALAAIANADWKGKDWSSPPRYSMDIGNRYVRIVKHDAPGSSRSVHSFVDRSNGDILKAAGWKAPAKHPRGNVFEPDYGIASAKAWWGGVRYL